MAHFAQLDSNNFVTQVIVVNNSDIIDSNGDEIESIGVAFCQKLLGADTNWKKTSYNNNIRGNYAGIGYTYMENVATLGVGSTDIFIRPQPYPSWTKNVSIAAWSPPITIPTLTDEQESQNAANTHHWYYEWNETAYQADNNTGWDLKDGLA